jgi:hypothetical protein
MNSKRRIRIKAVCLLLLCFSLVWSPAYALIPGTNAEQAAFEAWQAADILGIRPQIERLNSLKNQDIGDDGAKAEVVALRASVLRRILWGCLELRKACNKAERELAYSYDVLQKQQRKQDNVNAYLNALNFARLSVFYTLEPYARIHHEFKRSACFTTVAGPIGLFLPIVGIYYNKLSRARHCEPPKFLAHVMDGGPVDTEGLPQVVERYMDMPNYGSTQSRRAEMAALWKQSYHADLDKKSTLCSLTDGKGKSLRTLNNRIVLLWSLHTYIQHFDCGLYALLDMVRAPISETASTQSLKDLKFSTSAIEAAHLMKIEPLVAELFALKQSGSNSVRRLELETVFQEAVLIAMLDIRKASDKIDAELNYAYDIVLSNLLARRAAGLQLNYEANFIQSGTLGSIAGLLYYKQSAKPGNLMFVISGGLGTALSALGLWQMRGGKRKVDTPPNSLADFFHLRDANSESFSPMIWAFLNSPAPDSKTGKTRKDYLLEICRNNKVSTVNIDNKKNQELVSALSTEQKDTIAIVRSRINLLSALKARLESFDGELYDLVIHTDPATIAYSGNTGSMGSLELNPAAASAVKLLAAQDPVATVVRLKNGDRTQGELLSAQLAVTGKILSAALDVRKTVDRLDKEIVTETQALDRMTRMRDFAINATNNLNFFQLSILSTIIDGPLGLSRIPRDVKQGDTLNIVSGLMVGGLAGLAFMERPGGLRPSNNKAKPNMLGSAFGMDTPIESSFTPLMSRFMESIPADTTSGLTRREELIHYWQKSRLLQVNVKRPSMRQKLAANGPAHHMWHERMKLIGNRISMLYDLRATFDLMGNGMSNLLQAID